MNWIGEVAKIAIGLVLIDSVRSRSLDVKQQKLKKRKKRHRRKLLSHLEAVSRNHAWRQLCHRYQCLRAALALTEETK